HPDNLRAVCGPCNRRRARDHFVTVTRESDPEEWARCQATRAAWARRIAAEPPERVCDDEVGWRTAWRAIKRARGLPTRAAASPRRGAVGARQVGPPAAPEGVWP